MCSCIRFSCFFKIWSNVLIVINTLIRIGMAKIAIVMVIASKKAKIVIIAFMFFSLFCLCCKKCACSENVHALA